MGINEITWDGSNTLDVVNFCIKYCKGGMFSNLCGYISLNKDGVTIASGCLMENGKFKNYRDEYIEIPAEADFLCIEPTDTMRGSTFCVRRGETVKASYDGKYGFPMIRIKKVPSDA